MSRDGWNPPEYYDDEKETDDGPEPEDLPERDDNDAYMDYGVILPDSPY